MPAGAPDAVRDGPGGADRAACTNASGRTIAPVSRAEANAMARDHVCHGRAMTSEGLQGQGQEQGQEQERAEGVAVHEQARTQTPCSSPADDRDRSGPRCGDDSLSERGDSGHRALTERPLAGARGATFLSVPLWGDATHEITEADVAAYEQAYAGVDVRGELRRMLPWLDANPDKRSRTPLGSKRRIVGWLGRAQDRKQNHAQGRDNSHGSHQHRGHGMEQGSRDDGSPGRRLGKASGGFSRGQQRVEQALEELARAGVRVAAERPQAGTGEVWPAARRGDGRDAAGVVLPSYG